MSTRIRQAWLEALRAVGKERFISTSGFGTRFVCHMGDFFGENPFYNRLSFAPELRLAQAWLQFQQKPVVIDVGANVGFWSTQLAQMILGQGPRLYSFEPAPNTYCKLVGSIDLLGLSAIISPLSAAVSDIHSILPLSVNPRESGYAQVSDGTLNKRAGDRLAYAVSLTLDHFVEELGLEPHLVKIDVEGSEIRVLKGAPRLLSRPARPVVSFELNPLTLSETGEDLSAFTGLLPGYDFFYIDDFQGQRLEYGAPIPDLNKIDWMCNIFAIPSSEENRGRFQAALAIARARLAAA